MTKLIPFLSVENAVKAFAAYQKVFGAIQLNHTPFKKESSEHMNFPDDFDYGNSTTHMDMTIFSHLFMINDHKEPMNKSPVSFLFEMESQEQIEQIYQNCVDYGFEINRKLEKAEWGSYYTSLTDPFGIKWLLNFKPPTAE